MKPSRLRLDRHAMTTDAGRDQLREICRSIPLQPWTMDADSHFARVHAHLTHALHAAFPAPKTSRARSFLSDATWLLKEHRVWLRRQTLINKKRLRSVSAWIALRVWRTGQRWAVCLLAVSARLWVDAKAASWFVDSLTASRQELRRSIRHDRRCWLKALAATAPDLSVRDVVGRLRPLLRASGKKSSAARAIPAVHIRESGSGTMGTTLCEC